jgi:hypothetical protein
MKRKELTFVASWLYRHEPTNPVRQQINDILKPLGSHPTTEIEDTLFIHLIGEIKRVQTILKLENAKTLVKTKR